ncbi:MAG: Tat pathway signal protein [Anaerolineae bacterium]|nr:Tat pathway signal protein [Anaerolineae bacterium]
MSERGNADLIWGYLLHLSYNMWCDREAPEWGHDHVVYRSHLRFDVPFFRELLPQLAAAGANLLVIDLGDAVLYDSHPEIAVQGAWTPAKLRDELARVRDHGLEPIPKLNFSTAHDAWLGPYARCVSSPAYYTVCRDLIDETIALFDGPRFFHLGMDEETAQHQRHYAYAVLRQHELWWRDLMFYVNQVEAAGARAWVWSDYVWHHPEAFYANMPRSVLQSNWYYRTEFAPDLERVEAYDGLEAQGYDQVPTGSNWLDPSNLPQMVRYCRERIAPDRLLGFLQTVWKPTLALERARHEEAIACLAEARAAFESPAANVRAIAFGGKVG